jgi:hypothetical protein
MLRGLFYFIHFLLYTHQFNKQELKSKDAIIFVLLSDRLFQFAQTDQKAEHRGNNFGKHFTLSDTPCNNSLVKLLKLFAI